MSKFEVILGINGVAVGRHGLILWGFLDALTRFLSIVRVWVGGIVGRLIFKINIFKNGVFYITLLAYSFEEIGEILAEWGRHGSAWAHTLGKRSHGLQEGF